MYSQFISMITINKYNISIDILISFLYRYIISKQDFDAFFINIINRFNKWYIQCKKWLLKIENYKSKR